MSGHVYTDPEERKYLSVTSYIDIFNELGLLQDKAYFGHGMASEVGTQADKAITQICQGQPVGTEQWNAMLHDAKTCVKAWLRWQKKTGFVPRYAQLEVFSKRYGYAGTLDATGFANGILGLYDWKTGICRPQMLRLQLVLYLFAYLEMYPRRVIRQLRGIYLDKKTGEFNEMIIPIEEANEIFAEFLRLREQIDYKTLLRAGGLDELEYKEKKYNGGLITMPETALAKMKEDDLVLEARRDRAIEDLKIFYKDAPLPDVWKAAALIGFHGYSPENVYLIPYKNNKTGTTDWSIVVSIKGKRESVVKAGNRGLNYTYGADMFPRIMNAEEKIRAFGKNDATKVSAICRISDSLGNIVVGYGHFGKTESMKGTDKGNTPENMAMIRAEARALEKLPNVKALPHGVEVVSDEYIEAECSIIENPAQEVFEPPPAQPQAQINTVDTTPDSQENDSMECPIHQGYFFQEKGNGKSKWLAHPIEDDDRFPKGWCNKTKADNLAEEAEKVVTFEPEDIDFNTGEVDTHEIDYSDDDTFKDILRTCLVNLGWADEVNKKYNLAKLNQFIVESGMFPNVKTFKEVSIPQRSTLIERLQQEVKG